MSRLPAAAGLGLVGLSLFYLLYALGLPPGSVRQPGPGVFPLLVAGLLVATSLAFSLQVLARRAGAPEATPPGAAPRVAATMGALAAFCLLLPWLGYGVSAFGLLVVILRLFGVSRWPLAAALALAATGGSHALFAAVLGVPLPAGPWGF